MKKYLTLLFVPFHLCLAEEIKEETPHHVYLSVLDAYWQKLDTNINWIDIKANHWFIGKRLGYEYVQNKAPYIHVELGSFVSSEDIEADEITGARLDFDPSSHFFFNAKLAAGYTWEKAKWQLTPYLGVGISGIMNIDHHNEDGFEKIAPYAFLGGRIRKSLTESFSIGLNGCILHTFSQEESFTYRTPTEVPIRTKEIKKNHFGAEIGIPLIWHFGKTKAWDLHIEPYFLNFGASQKMGGTKILLGYRF